jgi:hypothetical protein
MSDVVHHDRIDLGHKGAHTSGQQGTAVFSREASSIEEARQQSLQSTGYTSICVPLHVNVTRGRMVGSGNRTVLIPHSKMSEFDSTSDILIIIQVWEV